MPVFQNGLSLDAPASQANGRTWCKWFYMTITQCLGLTIVDKDTNGRWDSTKGSGVNGATVTDEESQFNTTGDGYTFTSADEGRYITISGFTGDYADRNATYRILKVISSSLIELDILRSCNSEGLPPTYTGLTWKLWAADTTDCPDAADWFVYEGTALQGGGFNFHVKVTVGVSGTNTCYFPQFEVGPYGDWNGTSHVWGSSRHIDYGFINKDNSIYQVDGSIVIASMAADCIVIFTRTLDNYKSWHLTYIGEIDVADDVTDTNPVVMIQGSNGDGDPDDIIGYGLDSANTDIYKGARWLSASDDTATVTGYFCFHNVRPDADESMVSGQHRAKSSLSGGNYDGGITLECRDFATNGELRGVTRNLGMSNNDNRRCSRIEGGDRLHVFGGLSIDWHNSDVPDPRTGS